MRKMLISDFDDTLYCDEDSLKININKINDFRDKGNIFVIASARSYKAIETKIKNYSIPFDYLILNQGAVVLNKDMNVIFNYQINKNVVGKIMDSIKTYKENISNIRLFSIFDDDVELDSEVITKFRVGTNTIENAYTISKYIDNNFNEYVRNYVIDTGKYIFVEIIPIDTDKGVAIDKLIDIESIEKKYVYAIGNGSNDVEMLEKYNGYGMSNSEECVINIAKGLYDNVYNLIDEII